LTGACASSCAHADGLDRTKTGKAMANARAMRFFCMKILQNTKEKCLKCLSGKRKQLYFQ
jgi:hypothetical protein